MTTSPDILLLRALAALQSGRYTQTNEAGDVVVFVEEWERAFSPEVKALLDTHYLTSQKPRAAP